VRAVVKAVATETTLPVLVMTVFGMAAIPSEAGSASRNQSSPESSEAPSARIAAYPERDVVWVLPEAQAPLEIALLPPAQFM
jgi:hypothetical protein